MKVIFRLDVKSIIVIITLVIITMFSSCIERTSDCSGCGNRPWAPDDGGACYETEADCEAAHGSCQYCE